MADANNVSKIIGIQFSMFSPEEIKKNSVVEITCRDTYINNKPVIGGLFDPRMGVLEPGIVCPTDGMTYIDTPGYFGHIELAKPVFFIQHLKEIIKICRCVCFKCSKLLINKQHHKHILEKSSEERWDYVSARAMKVKRCGECTEDGCGCKQPDKIKQEGMASLFAIWEEMNSNAEEKSERQKISIKLTPDIILKIFKRISDDDVYFMGFSPKWSRPDWMICTVLPIAPPAVRPSVKHDAQQRSEDDLTHIYSTIIKTNTFLKEKLASGTDVNSSAIEMSSEILQHSIAMIANNKIKGVAPMAQRSGRPLQCIMGRINSKNGRIRGNLMGKRVDFSARSVITGDPNLSIQQLGVPLKIAKNITKPVVVNDRNKAFLTKLVQTGPDEWPGAKILERKNGNNISLRYIDRANLVLENGDIVHRHMMDGDVVLFNRQPSLHRMSMMGHIVKVMHVGDTFRMNVGDTKPYNADFDGDEMNMHMPQNVSAETELRHLAAIPYQQISPTSNTPIIGIFQDSLLGSYRFTRPNISFSPRQAMNLLVKYPFVDTSIFQPNGKTVTNFDIISQIMPPLTLKYKTKLYKDTEDSNTSNNVLNIRNGKYVKGQMEKSVLGSGSKGILHRICNDFGVHACADFNDNLQAIITEYMKTSSFSVGMSDLMADKETQHKISEIITKQKQKVQNLTDKVHLGILENNTATSNASYFETEVNNILNEATNEAGKVGNTSLSKDNRFVMIVESGSKGSAINITQMISCLGQQNVDGKRIPYGFDSRTLPHYTKFDDSPNARGFVENSYISGLTAPELFFHAMGGRIGLIDTAVKTAATGYIQRRLVKGLEDLKVEYDMTVRNNMGKVIQFAYGDDGFDSTKVEAQTLPLLSMGINDIYQYFDTSDESIYIPDTLKRVKAQKEEWKAILNTHIDKIIEQRDYIVEHIFRYKNETTVTLPVSFQYIISNIHGQLNIDKTGAVDITPLETFQLIEEYWKKMSCGKFMKANYLIEAMYYYYLSPRELLSFKRFHKDGIIMLLETILLKFKEAIVHPGEMVGVIAAQGIGEPSTQLTLNTFHNAGVGSKSNVTRGVPRIEEILRLTKNPKNASMSVYLHSIDECDKDKASLFASNLSHTKLHDMVKTFQICFDPNETCSNVIEDQALIDQFYVFENMVKECIEEPSANEQQKSKWIVRLEMDAEKMLDANITMDDIHFAITSSQYGNDVHCVFSDYNSDNLVFRIRLNSTIFNKSRKRAPEPLDQSDEIYMLKSFQDTLLNNIVLRGVNGIKNVQVRKLQNIVTKHDGKYVPKEAWYLDTTGSNLLDTLGLPYIDYTRTLSNDIKEVFNVLGIEAARHIIYNEVNEVMEYSGVYINYHHTSLLCDRMTCNKDMVSIFRSGLLNDNVGPIAKATFEVHTEVLLAASRHAEFDPMRGVSANILCGQNGCYGTGAFGIVLDMKMMDELDAKQVSDVVNLDDMENDEDDDDVCVQKNITINNNIRNIQVGMNQNTQCDDDYDAGF